MLAAPTQPHGLIACETAGSTLRLTLGAIIDAVEAGQTALRDFLLAHALDRKTLNRVEVIFEEVVSNAIRHGFAPGSDQTVRVTASCEAEAVQLLFEDDGTPFDPVQAVEPARPDSLETAPLGGLGIGLVRRLSSAMRYERARPDGLNRLWLTVNRAG